VFDFPLPPGVYTLNIHLATWTDATAAVTVVGGQTTHTIPATITLVH
jgi:hypothetical protein